MKNKTDGELKHMAKQILSGMDMDEVVDELCYEDLTKLNDILNAQAKGEG